MNSDFQKAKCYSWEDLHVHRRARSMTSFAQAQDAVNFIWHEEGCEYPPKIKAISKSSVHTVAHANRLSISIPERGIKTTILLHEIAHCLTSTAHGEGSAQHGPRWVGVYMKLLAKYAGFDLNELMVTARSAGVEFNFKGKVI